MGIALLFLGAMGIGFVSSMAGIGGGTLMVPYMILLFGYDTRTAVASSLVTVIATSCSSAGVYFNKKMVDLDVALILTPSTVLGAIIGSHLNLALPITTVRSLLGATLMIVAILIGVEPYIFKKIVHLDTAGPNKYYDEGLGKYVRYGVKNRLLGAALATLGGFASGFFGIGGGVIKVPIMVLVMGIPIKIAAATSSFMIGLTAATGSMEYVARGIADIATSATLIAGIIPGATLGARTMGKTKPWVVRAVFAVLLFYAGAQIFLKASGV